MQHRDHAQEALRIAVGRPHSGASGPAKDHRNFQSHGLRPGEDVYYYILYTTHIQLGNPPQPFRAQIDIGWGDMFVPSSNCTYDSYEARYCIPHKMYNSSQSSSYAADLSPARIHYMGTYTWGNVSRDSLHVAGLEIKNQIFEEATVWRPIPLYWDDLLDSALGLARLPLNFSESTIKAQNPLLNMIGQNLLDRNVFSLRLARTDVEKGQLSFGSVDHDLYTGDLVSFPATNVTCGDDEAIAAYSSSGWQIPVRSISLSPNSSSGSIYASLSNHTAILSTSFPHIALPRGLAQRLTERCGTTEMTSPLSCESRTMLPDLTLTLGPDSHEIVLTPWDYMFEVEDQIYGKRCILPFVDLPEWLDGYGYIMLGTAFLSGLYSVFDYDSQTISREPNLACPVK